MPAACATSSTLTASNPRALNSSIATSAIWPRVVERRRPTLGASIATFFPSGVPFRHSMPYSVPHGPDVSSLTRRKAIIMEHDQQVSTGTDLVEESLVEEVSIDGMCGVY